MNNGEVTISRAGRQFGATYTVNHGMLEIKTHTETRSIELGDEQPAELATRVLTEIVDAQTNT